MSPREHQQLILHPQQDLTGSFTVPCFKDGSRRCYSECKARPPDGMLSEGE